MYAIIEACGKQYKVQEGDIVFVERLQEDEGSKVTFDKVLLVSDDKTVKVGEPTVKGAKVTATVIGHGKDKKIIVFKYKAKKNERKTRGHRQSYTKIQIEKITASEPKVKKEDAVDAVKAPEKTTKVQKATTATKTVKATKTAKTK